MNLFYDMGRDVEQHRLAFLLLDGFALMSYAALIEPFRAANTLRERPLYSWSHISLDGQPVRASNGATIMADHGLADAIDADMLFLFAAGDPRGQMTPALAAWLRRMARRGVTVAGVSAAPYLLAGAGLLDGHRATIHWDHRDAFEEAFPHLVLDEALYVIDRGRITCAGGMAGMELARALIERRHGADLASRVGDWYIGPDPRPADRPQRSGAQGRFARADARLARVLDHMEAHVEQPASREDLAALAGVTVRQLERLFARHVGEGLAAHYLRLRTQRAMRMLRSTGLSVTEIAFACGFASASHFSSAFRRLYGQSPRAAREDGRTSSMIAATAE